MNLGPWSGGGATQCAARSKREGEVNEKIRGARIRSAKAGGMRSGRAAACCTRRAAPDPPDTQAPAAAWPDRVCSLSVIAGMAHSTLESEAATRKRRRLWASAEDPAAPAAVWPRYPTEWISVRSWSNPAADVANHVRDPLRRDQCWIDSQREWAAHRPDATELELRTGTRTRNFRPDFGP